MINSEIVKVFGELTNKKDAGFAVVRILGKDMNPNNIMTLISIMKDSKMNLDQLKPLQDLMLKNQFTI